MATHQAYRLHSYGGPECIKLDTVPVPKPEAGEVLVAISKAGINPFDWKIRAGYVKDQMPLPLPYTLGADFVGTVAALGEGSLRFQVGDRVMSITNKLGAYAEHIAIKENILARVPDAIPDEDAATLPMPGLTAWQALYAAGLVRTGITVLVVGASGTAGAMAVQFAKAAGAKVVGTASAKNKDFVLDLGADDFIDYRTERFEERKEQFDLILDFALGPNGISADAWKVVKDGGAIVSVANPGVQADVPSGKSGLFRQTSPDASLLEDIVTQYLDGKLKTKVARVFSREQLHEAMELNQNGGTTGRLILDFKKA